MTTAVARVEQKIIITGADNASDAVRKAQASLKGLEGQAKRAAEAADKVKPGEGVKAIQEKSGDIESALGSLRDFLPEMDSGLNGVAQAGGAVEAVMRLLPGPIGLAAAGIAGMGIAAYALNKHLNETAAKFRLLSGATDARALDAQFDLGVDGAVKLSQALDDLGRDAVRPTDAAIRQVIENAKAMGQEPAEAVAKYIAAWKEGPEAIRKVQQEIGTVGVQMQTVSQVARSIGLDPKSLGLDASATAAGRLTQALEASAKLRKQEADTAIRIAELTETSRNGKAAERADALASLKAAQDQLATIRSDLQLEEYTASFRAKKVEQEKAFGQVSKDVASIREQADLDAQQAGSRQTALAHRLNGIESARALIERQIAVEQALIAKGAGDEAKARLQSLQRSSQQLDIQEQQAKDQAAAERRSRAQAAAAEAQARRQADLDVQLRVARARADRDGLQTERERIDLLNQEQAKALDATRGVKGTKAQAAARLAVEEEFATKRAALQRAIADEVNRTAEETQQTAEEQARRSTELARAATESATSLAKARATSLTASLRAQGQEEQADLVELRQAHADYAVEREAIGRRIAEAQRGLNAQSEDYKNLELQRLAALTEAELRRDDLLRQIAQRQREAKRAQVADAIGKAADGPAALLQQMGGSAPKVGEALAGVAAGAKDVAKNWGDIGKAAPGAINAAGAVALAFVSSEREKAGVLAAMEAAHSVAAFAIQDYVGGASHAAAAALYGGIAVGAFGSSSGASAGSAGGSQGGFSAGATATGQQPTSSGQGAVVYNFNGLMTTRQQVAKGLVDAERTLQSTGYRKAKGV